jgi:hypothetical protein
MQSQCLVLLLPIPKSQIRNLILRPAMLTYISLQQDFGRGIQIGNGVRILPSTPFECAIYIVFSVIRLGITGLNKS